MTKKLIFLFLTTMTVVIGCSTYSRRYKNMDEHKYRCGNGYCNNYNDHYDEMPCGHHMRNQRN